MKQIYVYCLLFFLSGASVFGQTAQSRGAFLEKIDNDNSSFSVLVEVDRPDRVYQEGEILQIYVTSKEDGYLYLFYRDADAKVQVLFPNRFEQDNRIQQDVRVPVPGPGAGFRIRVGAPFGHELLKAVVSKRPLPFIDSAMDFAKFAIAPVDDTTGDTLSNAIMERRAEFPTEPPDWAEHEINILTMPRTQSGSGNAPPNRPSPPSGASHGTAKVHLILAADISELDNVGRNVWADAHNVRELLENNIDGGRLNTVDLETRRTGNLLTKNDILQAIRGLNADSDDAVFFFYSGHGAVDSVAGQYFALASKEQVFRSEILEAMKSLNARLTILVSDCCSNQHDVDPSIRPRSPHIAPKHVTIKGLRPLVEKLFFEASGVVDITAAEEGTYGFIYPAAARYENDKHKGSVFTWNFCKKLNSEMFATRNWEQMFELVRVETNRNYQEVFGEHINAGRVEQKELNPYAFLPLAQ